jgi:hypothetical protein
MHYDKGFDELEPDHLNFINQEEFETEWRKQFVP